MNISKLLLVLPATVAALISAAAPITTSLAAAATIPNQVAVMTSDRLVAFTYAGYPTRTTLANAGAFATMMIRNYGMTGIPNYDPTSAAGSTLVCWEDMGENEVIAAYGITGDGVAEATYICNGLQSDGHTIQWR